METQLVEHKKSFGKEVIISLVALADDPQTNLVKLKFIRDGKITFYPPCYPSC